MNFPNIVISISFIALLFFSCNNETNIYKDSPPICNDGNVNAIIEIPAGTVEKWEFNKKNGELQRDSLNGKPRTINYLGYPGNYGMIPQTILPKEKGGDGDPLDIIVIGAPMNKGSITKCKIIGVLKLLDSDEKDDKLIAVAHNSSLYQVNSLTELNNQHHGILEIIEIWFTNYKGPNKMISLGYSNQETALDILNSAITEYQSLLK
jgi:inorganic pyrophosphatase